jgi:hypothetical protein
MKNKEIEQVKQEIKVLQSKLALMEKMEKYKSPCEEAYKEWMGKYPPTDESVDNTDDIRWRAFQMGWMKAQQTYKVGTYQPTPQTPEQVEEGLKQAFREAKKSKEWKDTQKKIDTPIRREEFGDKLIEKLMANPPDFLTFQLSQTLEDLITDWWSDIFTSQSGLDMEGCIHNLCERIENWLPDESSSAGSQDNYAIVAVDAENQLLQKIKSKIYSKENTL